MIACDVNLRDSKAQPLTRLWIHVESHETHKSQGDTRHNKLEAVIGLSSLELQRVNPVITITSNRSQKRDLVRSIACDVMILQGREGSVRAL
jgi:hypothetical protein